MEDNDPNRKLFCEVLRSQGFAVEPVADGDEALERARPFAPNLIVVDIQMPDISGLDLIAAANADTALGDVPVPAMTADAGKGDKECLRDAGAEGYRAKPMAMRPFIAAVQALADDHPRHDAFASAAMATTTAARCASGRSA